MFGVLLRFREEPIAVTDDIEGVSPVEGSRATKKQSKISLVER